jgi:hypothetical protein
MDRITITISDETSQQLYASLRIVKDKFILKSNMFAKLVDDIGNNVNLSVPCEEMADILISILLDKPQIYYITHKLCNLLDKFQLIEPMKKVLDDHFCNDGSYDQLTIIERIYFATLGKSIWELSTNEWSDKVETWWRWIKQNNMFGSENEYNLDEIISKMEYNKFIEMTRYDGDCQDGDAKLTYLWIENRGIMDERIIKNIGFANLTKPTRTWWLQCLSDTNNVIAMKIAIASIQNTSTFKYDTYNVKGVTSLTKRELLDSVDDEIPLFDQPSLPTISFILNNEALALRTANNYNVTTIQYAGCMKIIGHVSISCGELCDKDTLTLYSTPELNVFEENSYVIYTANIDMIMRIRDDDTIDPSTKIELEYDLIVNII